MTKDICSSLCLTPDIFLFKLINITKEPAYSTICIRLSGSFTVPQVFLQKQLLGNASKFNCCFEKNKSSDSSIYKHLTESKGDCSDFSTAEIKQFCSEIYSKLLTATKSYVKHPGEKIDFPPLPDAKFVKVTSSLAFSSQPTIAQLSQLKSFGFESVVNLTPSSSPLFNQREQNIISTQGLKYFNSASKNLVSLLKELKSKDLKPPSLFHDGDGSFSGLVVLLISLRSVIETEVNDQKARKTSEYLELLNSWIQGLGLSVNISQNDIEEVVQSLGSFDFRCSRRVCNKSYWEVKNFFTRISSLSRYASDPAACKICVFIFANINYFQAVNPFFWFN
eukprot:snap_masked-scaffold_79-processed-gene-0.9-mRNA-1 protein AED:1.00 eAED:1.00 QI:0/0/0/0/1/1/3/0/335